MISSQRIPISTHRIGGFLCFLCECLRSTPPRFKHSEFHQKMVKTYSFQQCNLLKGYGYCDHCGNKVTFIHQHSLCQTFVKGFFNERETSSFQNESFASTNVFVICSLGVLLFECPSFSSVSLLTFLVDIVTSFGQYKYTWNSIYP